MLCLAAGAAGVAGAVVGAQEGAESGGAGDTPERPAGREDGERPRDPAARLTLEQQLGQLLVMSFDGVKAPE